MIPFIISIVVFTVLLLVTHFDMTMLIGSAIIALIVYFSSKKIIDENNNVSE